jgi:hypothetical protein
MKMIYSLLTLTLLCLGSCSQEDSAKSAYHVVDLAARDDGNPEVKPIVYRVKTPKHWFLQLPASNESIVDTTKAIAHFFIFDGNEKIGISVHNFPSDSMEQRIAPFAQITRWKKQFQSLDQASVSLTPQAFGGYHGFLLEATGQMSSSTMTIFGWALQLAPEHYRALSQPLAPSLMQRYRQMRGDVTIKAVGPAQIMAAHRDDIIAFARSFQLIDDIP